MSASSEQSRRSSHRFDSPTSSGIRITPEFVLGVLRSWWKIAGPIAVVLAAVGATIVYLQFEPQYRATAVLMIYDRPQGIVRGPDIAPRFVQNQIQVLRSDRVLDPLVNDPECARIPELAAAANPKSAANRRIGIRNVGGSEMYNLYFTCGSPENAALLVNKLVEIHLRTYADFLRARTEQLLSYVESEKSARQMEMYRLRETVRELAKQLTGRDPFAVGPQPGDGEVEVAGSDLLSLLVRMELSQSVAQEHIADLRSKIETNAGVVVSEAEIAQAIEEHPDIQQLRHTVDASLGRLADYESTSVDVAKTPGYRKLQLFADRTNEELAKLREDLKEPVRERITTAKQKDRSVRLKGLQGKHELDTITQRVYQRLLDEQRESAQEYTGDTLELEFARAELTLATSLYNRLATNLVMLQTGKTEPERISLWQEASIPTAPLEVVPWKKIGTMSMMLFVIPFGLALLWELRLQRVTDRGQVEQQTHIDVIGEIACLPRRIRVGKSGRARLFEESVDSLRTSLLLTEQLLEIQVLAVTSPTSREGKTSVASQLAVSIARATGEPTLLIDGDMRSPDIHSIFDIESEPGLAEVLDGSCKLADAINRNWSGQLHLLPAGKLKSSPHRLLGGGAYDRLLDSLRQTYRYIVVDTPPVLAAGEALVLARGADSAVLCSMLQKSRIHQMKLAWERLTTTGTRPAGVVINGVPVNTYSYYYGSYDYARDFVGHNAEIEA